MPTFKTAAIAPRWGHEDDYTFEFTQESMTITMMQRTAKCIWVDNRDPRWEDQSLVKIFENDSIYPPAILPRLYEHLWLSWRNGDITESEVDAELQAVTKWLDAIMKAQPGTDFWKKFF